MHSSLRLIVFPIVILGLALPLAPLRAQEAQPPQQDDKQTGQSGQSDQQPDAKPTKKVQETARERRQREAKLHKELDNVYKKWLDEDVTYIITPEERSAFLRLQTNEEREQFIEQFWLRLGHPRLEDRPRPHLHHVGSPRRSRFESFRRLLRAPRKRRRR